MEVVLFEKDGKARGRLIYRNKINEEVKKKRAINDYIGV